MKKILLLISFFAFIIVFSQAQNHDFKVTTWNVEWLSCEDNGPTDENLQMNNVVTVIKTMNSDIVALQEIGTSGSYATVDTLVRRLGNEWGGRIVAYSATNCSQNLALIYKKSRVEIVNSALMSSAGTSYNWSGGRYPALFSIRLLAGDTKIPISLINIHAKAMGDESSYLRRKGAIESLKTLLDSDAYNRQNIILLGDFNDYLVGTQCSSCSPADSPYKVFVDDVINFKGLTGGLKDPYYNKPVIDNIILSNELFSNFKNNVFRDVSSTNSISNYRNTTSDHYPVTGSLTFNTGDAPNCDNFTFSETFAQSLGDFASYSVAGDQLWHWRATYGAYVSGYANSVNNANENWLISPALDLSSSKSATFNFDHALHHAGTETEKLANHTLWLSNNYNSGAPSTATWTKVEIPTMASGNSWTFVNSGNVSIPTQMLKPNTRIAFKYLSTPAVAATWEIKNFLLNGQCVVNSVDRNNAENESVVYAQGRNIKVESVRNVPVSIYDISGRVLFSTTMARTVTFTVAHQGVYIVMCGNKAIKVAVR